MAYELVDAVQLNNDLLDIADAIRAKSQGQDPLLFPSEFISEIGSIPTGASITGATDLSTTAMEAIAAGDTIMAYKDDQPGFYKYTATVGGAPSRCRFNPAGTILAVTNGSTQRITLFDVTNNFSKMANPGTCRARRSFLLLLRHRQPRLPCIFGALS